MSPLLFSAIIMAAAGFVLLLRPKTFRRPFQREKGAALSNGMEAFLRLVGVGALFLSALLAQLV